METLQSINTRRSVRAYDTKKRASQEQIEELLKAAMHAPSAKNCRPWEFLVVTDEDLLEQTMQIHPYCNSLGDAGTAIIVCGNLDNEYKTEYGGYYVYDCSAATENILIRANDLGLSTCWCGIAPNKQRMKEFRKLFNIPQNVEPMSLIIVGYAKVRPQEAQDTFEKSKIHNQKW